MPFEIGEAINSIADKVISSPTIDSIARNPIYTSVLIVFVIILIMLFIFRDVETDDSLLSLCLRSGFYIFLVLTATLFIHNKVLMRETSAVAKGSEVANVFEKQGAYSGIMGHGGPTHTIEESIIPVQVKYDTENSF